jgi:RNA polymerase sigma factor (sigma-70 family)
MVSSPIIHIVDDDTEFRTAIGRLLRAAGYRIALYESAMQLLQRLPDDFEPGCILLDVRLPDLGGPELQKRLAELGSILPIVFLTGHGDISTSVDAIKAGAEDFLTKPVEKARLLDAVGRAVARHRTVQSLHDRLKAFEKLVATLTPREKEVFELIVRGKQNKQVADELGTSERTIKAHRQKVMEKFRTRSLLELVSIARDLGYLTASVRDIE